MLFSFGSLEPESRLVQFNAPPNWAVREKILMLIFFFYRLWISETNVMCEPFALRLESPSWCGDLIALFMATSPQTGGKSVRVHASRFIYAPN